MNWLFLFSLLALTLAVDYYEVLGINRDATDREIKKAYRALSRQYHPDKNRGQESAAQKFIEIAEAYEVLSDPQKRREFDMYGDDQGFHGMHHDPMDMFQEFFGQQFQNKGLNKGPDAVIHVPVSLVNIYNGDTVEFSAELDTICDECDGSGSEDGEQKACTRCKGQGVVVERIQLAPGMIQQVQHPCDSCNGKGKQVLHACPICEGHGTVKEERKYNVNLERGAPSEFIYVIENEGDQSSEFLPGDLKAIVVESSEGNLGYRRRGSDLFRTEVLSAAQAATGNWDRELTRLDNQTMIVLNGSKRKQIFDGYVEILKNEGLPVPQRKKRGDLYITYRVIGSLNRGKTEL